MPRAMTPNAAILPRNERSAKADDQREAGSRKLREGITRARGAQQQADGHDAEQHGNENTQRDAEFFACDGKDEIGMGIGKAIFDRARARSDSNEPAGLERLE